VSFKSDLQDGAYEWLIAILLSWWIPFQLLGTFHVTYFRSLILWALPVAFLYPRFLSRTHRGSRRRQAFWWTTLTIVLLGVALDWVFGGLILDFSCGPGKGKYIVPCVWGIGGSVPIEEFLFYVLGAMAVLLVYIWGDQYWFALYNIRQRESLIPAAGHIIDMSWETLGLLAGLLLIGIDWKLSYTWDFASHTFTALPFHSIVPTYYAFLAVAAFAPLVFLYRSVMPFVNWRALSFAGMFVILTASVWEVTLALPNKWWSYKWDAMIGKRIPAWSWTTQQYPIEALIVWIVFTFVAVFIFEAFVTFFYDPRPSRIRLFGGGEWPFSPVPPPTPEVEGMSLIVESGSDDAMWPLRPLSSVLKSGSLAGGPFEVVAVSSGGAIVEELQNLRVVSRSRDDWRSTGAADARYPILCFMQDGLAALPHVFEEIRSVLESPRIIGGSTTAWPDKGFLARIRAIFYLPYAWITGFDRGIVFCRVQDFERIPDGIPLLSGLRSLGRKSRRVITRIPDYDVRLHPQARSNRTRPWWSPSAPD